MTHTCSSSVSLNHPFEPIQAPWRLGQCVLPKRRHIWPLHSAETRHLTISQCYNSGTTGLNVWTQLRLTSVTNASRHPLCFVSCLPRQTYSSFALRPPLCHPPLQAVSVSWRSKFFGFQLVSRRPQSVKLLGASPSEGPRKGFCISHLIALFVWSVELYAQVGPPRKFWNCFCSEQNSNHNFRR